MSHPSCHVMPLCNSCPPPCIESCDSSWNNFPRPWDPCRCRKCRPHRRENSHRRRHRHRSRDSCRCVELFPCIPVKCGYLSANLTKTATPSTFSGAGITITYSYAITNTGTVPICAPLDICDDKLGGWIIPSVYILPGTTQTFNRNYITTADDVTAGTIVNTAVAYLKVTEYKWLVTPTSTFTVTYNNPA